MELKASEDALRQFEALTAEGLVRLTNTIDGMVHGHYEKRSEWHDIRGVQLQTMESI